MKYWLLLASLAACSQAPSEVETAVHQRVEEMMKAEDGSVVFSDLHNSKELSADEREYLDRLYEIFFAVPAYLQSESRAADKIPTIDDIAKDYRIHPEAVRLLLTVMTSDSRMPTLIILDEESGEIESLDMKEIDKFVKTRGSQVKVSGWIGKPVPAFEVTTLKGKTITNEDLIGNNTLLFFWLTHCPVCQRITPNMVELYKRYGSADFEILGLNVDLALGLDVTDEERREFIAERGIEYPVAILDPETRSAFGNVNIFPAMFLVKSDGTIGELLLNYQDLETLVRLVEEERKSKAARGGVRIPAHESSDTEEADS
jgi:thiol-disulfide isomerase/thioredoxin